MAKKKVTHQSQSNDHKPSMEDPSHQIQNLKNLNSVLLKETTQHRQQIESLRSENQALLETSAMDSDKNLALELENGVLSVFTEAQMKEVASRFERLVGERDEKENEVEVLKGEMNDLEVRFESEKLRLGGEKDRVKSEGEDRERKLKEEMWVLKLEGEKLMGEISEKERAIEELVKERDLGLISSQESAKVIDGLKEEIDRVTREKDEIETLNKAQVAKATNLELEVSQLGESLKVSRDEEALLRGKILELEESVGLAVEKEEEMVRKNSALLSEKKEMEKSIEVLTEKRDSVNRALEMVQREMENKQGELDEANRARDESEQVKANQEYAIAEAQGELGRLRDVVDKLKGSIKEIKEENEKLLSQLHKYKDAIEEVTLEKDNMRKGFEEEKNKVEKLELQIAGMEKKIEQAESEFGKMKNEREKLNERNKEVENNVDVLKKEKEAIQNTLQEAKQECDDLRAKIEFFCNNSNKALAMLKSTAALVRHENGAREVVHDEKKLVASEIQPYAEELDTIRNAFKSKTEIVDDLKQQIVLLQKNVDEAHKGKGLLTMLSSATTILAAVLAAYVAKGR